MPSKNSCSISLRLFKRLFLLKVNAAEMMLLLYFNAQNYNDPSTGSVYNLRGLTPYGTVFGYITGYSDTFFRSGDIFYSHNMECPIEKHGSTFYGTYSFSNYSEYAIAIKLESGDFYCKSNAS